jgi:hypothetical protein
MIAWLLGNIDVLSAPLCRCSHKRNPAVRVIANCIVYVDDSQWRADNQPGPNNSVLRGAARRRTFGTSTTSSSTPANTAKQSAPSSPFSQFNTPALVRWPTPRRPRALHDQAAEKARAAPLVAGIEGVEYEAHGNIKPYNPNQVEWVDTTPRPGSASGSIITARGMRKLKAAPGRRRWRQHPVCDTH